MDAFWKEYVVSLEEFTFDKKTKCLYGYSESFAGHFPETIKIKSNYTGKIMEFVKVPPTHPLFDEDHWDGEMQIYIPAEQTPNVTSLIIHHAY